MQPIVNGLQEEVVEVEFVSLNAQDNAEGEALFDQLGLLGHPSFMLYDASGTEVYRAIGVVEEDVLRQAVISVIADE